LSNGIPHSDGITQLLKVFFYKPKQAGFSSPVEKPGTEKTKKLGMSSWRTCWENPSKSGKTSSSTHVGPAKPPTYQPLVDYIMGEICEKTIENIELLRYLGIIPSTC
jgi:hypothetical protein